jgi:hypothetical protein
MSCSSTPKSRMAEVATGASACPFPGSEKNATPSLESTREISLTAAAMFGTWWIALRHTAF